MSADLVAGALDVAQDAGGAVEQALAGLGQAHAAVDAGEQGGTEFFLEPLHLACQRRLGHAQMRRGARDAAQLGDTDEIGEAAEFHAPALYARIPCRRDMARIAIRHLLDGGTARSVFAVAKVRGGRAFALTRP